MIPLNKSTQLEFSMSIKNSSETLQRANLVIDGGAYEISLPISLKDGKALVKVPMLENVLTPGKHKIRMDVVLGGALYVPFQDVLEFAAPPSIQVESKKSEIEPNLDPVISVNTGLTVTDSGEGNGDGPSIAPASDPPPDDSSEEDEDDEKKVEESQSNYQQEFVRLMEEAFRTMKSK